VVLLVELRCLDKSFFKAGRINETCNFLVMSPYSKECSDALI